MTRDEMLRQMERLFEMPPNKLTGGERLADIPGWDSLATLSFITLAEKSCGIKLNAEDILASKTVNDLLALLRL